MRAQATCACQNPPLHFMVPHSPGHSSVSFSPNHSLSKREATCSSMVSTGAECSAAAAIFDCATRKCCFFISPAHLHPARIAEASPRSAVTSSAQLSLLLLQLQLSEPPCCGVCNSCTCWGAWWSKGLCREALCGSVCSCLLLLPQALVTAQELLRSCLSRCCPPP